MSALHQRTINDLVAENHVRASVLYYFGVRFYDYQEATLEQVCKQHGLNPARVAAELESLSTSPVTKTAQLRALPVDLVMEYLKHAHYLFVKKRLPYIGQLIDGLSEVNFRYVSLSRDIKEVFPLFVEDFIHHIYEEEDTLFSYINQLTRFLSGEISGSKLFYSMERQSIQTFALHHSEDCHEMEGFRKITNNYAYCDEADLHIKVLFNELAQFEKDLIAHAKIEDDILFPKALQLERQVKLRFHELIKLN